MDGNERQSESVDDKVAHLFGPQTMLPDQFFEEMRRDHFVDGERALMLAVLEDGIRCFQEHLRDPRSNPRLLSEEAEAWIRSDDDKWPFSFVNVCEALGINPPTLRKALLTWKESRLAKQLTPPSDKVAYLKDRLYRLHLRTKRKRYIR